MGALVVGSTWPVAVGDLDEKDGSHFGVAGARRWSFAGWVAD